MTKGRIGVVLMAAAIIAVSSGVFFLNGRSFASAPFSRLLAQVGVAVGIAANPYNTLDAQLQAKQVQLDEQQADLAAREAALASSTASGALPASPSVVWYLVIAVGVLALLVGLNFYLDWRRSEREKAAGRPPEA